MSSRPVAVAEVLFDTRPLPRGQSFAPPALQQQRRDPLALEWQVHEWLASPKKTEQP
jgi:hypothetical protein